MAEGFGLSSSLLLRGLRRMTPINLSHDLLGPSNPIIDCAHNRGGEILRDLLEEAGMEELSVDGHSAFLCCRLMLGLYYVRAHWV